MGTIDGAIAMNETGIVDTHVHFWDVTRPTTVWPTPEWARIYRLFGPAEFAQAALPVGVTNGVLVESGTTDEDNRYLYARAESSPLIGGFAPFVDVTNPSVGQELEYWSTQPKCKAVRTRFEGHPDGEVLTRESTIHGLRQVAAYGFAFEFLVGVEQLPDVLRAYEQIPNLKGIIEHMGKPNMRSGTDWVNWKTQMERLAANTPVTVKLSLGPRLEELEALKVHPEHGWDVEIIKPYAQWLADKFGPERLMWGSDWPLVLLESDYASTLDAMRQALGPINSQTGDAIFRTTALRFYNLDATTGR